MTKCILAGGSDRKFDGYGVRLAAEIRKTVGNPSILSCFFSSEEPTWQEKFADWHGWFEGYFGKDIKYELAIPVSFLEQVRRADVIYLHGGQTVRLLEALPNFEHTERAFAGKIVVGSSAGANYLSKAGYSPSADEFLYGSGIVAKNVIVHYGAEDFDGVKRTLEDWLHIRQRLEQFVGGGDATVPLPEGEFIIVEQ